MDKVKIGFNYLKLGILYIILLVMRLFCFASIKDVDEPWFRKAAVVVPAGFTIVLVFLLESVDKVVTGSLFDITFVAYVLICVLMCMGVITLISLFMCEFEYLLDIFLRQELDFYEKRYGKKKEKSGLRRFCMSAKETSYNFFSYGWIFSIVAAFTVIVYFATLRDVTATVMRVGQAFGAFFVVMGYGWKKRSYYYSNRQKNEYRERNNRTQKESAGFNKEQNTYQRQYQQNTQQQNDGEQKHDPIMCGYFNGCSNIRDVKKIYHELARTLHPDAGGDPDKFRMLKEEYEYVLKKWNVK